MVKLFTDIQEECLVLLRTFTIYVQVMLPGRYSILDHDLFMPTVYFFFFNLK